MIWDFLVLYSELYKETFLWRSCKGDTPTQSAPHFQLRCKSIGGTIFYLEGSQPPTNFDCEIVIWVHKQQ